jgi:hypothetical protein
MRRHSLSPKGLHHAAEKLPAKHRDTAQFFRLLAEHQHVTFDIKHGVLTIVVSVPPLDREPVQLGWRCFAKHTNAHVHKKLDLVFFLVRSRVRVRLIHSKRSTAQLRMIEESVAYLAQTKV